MKNLLNQSAHAKFNNKTGILMKLILAIAIIVALHSTASANQNPDKQQAAEKALGECLTLNIFLKYGPPVKNDALQEYVNILGNALAKNLPSTPHPFHFIVIGGTLYKSFGLPGGIVVIGESQLKRLNNEAELAAVLAREIAHIKYKHALQLIPKSKKTATTVKNDQLSQKEIIDKRFMDLIEALDNILFVRGLNPDMVHKADAFAMDLLYRTGYNPESMINVLKQMQNFLPIQDGRAPSIASRILLCHETLKHYTDFNTLAINSKRFRQYIKP